MTMILSAIAAMSKNRVIGKNNQLPWHLPEDFQFFKDKTKNSIMIMGRKTFDSLPGLLKGRFHIIISRDPLKTEKQIKAKMGLTCYLPELTKKQQGAFLDAQDAKKKNIEVAIVSKLGIAIELADMMLDPAHFLHREGFGQEVFVIGGGEIYQQSLPQLDRIYLTRIEKDYEGDAYFPEFEHLPFKLTAKLDRHEPIAFSFCTYERRAQN